MRHFIAATFVLALLTAASSDLAAQGACVQASAAWYEGKQCTIGSLTFTDLRANGTSPEYEVNPNFIIVTPFSFVDHDLDRWSGFRFEVLSSGSGLNASASHGNWGNRALFDASVFTSSDIWGMGYSWKTTGFSAAAPPYPTDGGYAGLAQVAIFGNNPDGQSVNVNADTWQTLGDGTNTFANWNPNTRWLFDGAKTGQVVGARASVEASLRTIDGEAYAELTSLDILFRESAGDAAIVPEPATLVLLATGLIGLFGASITRRSRRR